MFYPNKLKFCTIIDNIMNIPLFFTFTHVQGKQLTYFLIWKKTFNITLFLGGHCESEIFQLCMIIIFLGVYIFTVGLTTFVSRWQMCQKYKLQSVFLDFCLDSCLQ